MVFTSIPAAYLDPPSWQQQQNQYEANGSERCELLPVPAALPQQNHAPTATPSEIALKCPRCESTNTKFCYFNNYSLSQPRHFCKTCRRYWTRGGALRNVPVGGGFRRNKKIKRTTTGSKSPLSNDQESQSLLLSNSTSAANFINSSSHEQFGHFINPNNRPNYISSLIQNQIQSRYGSGGLQMGVHGLTSGIGGEGGLLMDQWRFPFFNGFESTSAVPSEIVEATTSRVTQQQPSVKLEYNGGINFSKSPLSNNHYNSWGTNDQLSAFATSSASHLL